MDEPVNRYPSTPWGIKIENPKATAHAEELTKIKGLAFAEWGPGDQAFYLLGAPKVERVVRDASGTPTYVAGSNNHEPPMVKTRARVLAATKALAGATGCGPTCPG